MKKEKLQETLEKLEALYKASLELELKIEATYGELLSLQDEMTDLGNDILVGLEQLNQ